MAYDFSAFTQKVQKTLDHIHQDISTLRTGRASAQMLDVVRVEAYGTMMKLSELANVSVPDSTLLVVSPWDKSLLSVIEKAIATSPLNLHPIVDGIVIRIAVPPLTEERRKEMVKLLGQKIESGKVMLRTIRGDFKKEIEKRQASMGLSEDTIAADLVELEKQVKNFMATLDQLAQDKAKELMKI